MNEMLFTDGPLVYATLVFDACHTASDLVLFVGSNSGQVLDQPHNTMAGTRLDSLACGVLYIVGRVTP